MARKARSERAAAATARKRAQRERDRAEGWAEITVRVRADRIAEVRAFAESLGEPPAPADPGQAALPLSIEDDDAAA